MNIVMNAVFFHEKARGVGRAANSVIKKLSEVDDKNQYYIYYGTWQQYDFLNIKKENFNFIPLNITRNSIIRNFYLAFILPIKLKKYNPDVYHILDTSPVIYKTCKTISTVYDLAEFTVPEKYSKFKCFFRKRYVKYQIKNSDKVITSSEYTKKDMINRFNVNEKKINVLPIFFDTDVQFDESRKYEKYFLIVGEIERTKNIEIVLKAFSLLPNDLKNSYKIYIVGRKGNDYLNVCDMIRNLNLKDRAIIFDYVSDKKLFELYKNAYALIFPSLFEGFGLPILEAMSFGIPVISSNVTSMPEVIGDAGLLFDPKNESDLCSKILKIIEKPEIRKEMICKGFEQIKKFNGDDYIKNMLEIYSK